MTDETIDYKLQLRLLKVDIEMEDFHCTTQDYGDGIHSIVGEDTLKATTADGDVYTFNANLYKDNNNLFGYGLGSVFKNGEEVEDFDNHDCWHDTAKEAEIACMSDFYEEVYKLII